MTHTAHMGQIRYQLPDELHRRLKAQAAIEGVSLRELIVRLLQERLKNE